MPSVSTRALGDAPATALLPCARAISNSVSGQRSALLLQHLNGHRQLRVTALG